jgi:hypothetical protein
MLFKQCGVKDGKMTVISMTQLASQAVAKRKYIYTIPYLGSSDLPSCASKITYSALDI